MPKQPSVRGYNDQIDLEMALYVIIWKRPFWNAVLHESKYGIKVFRNEQQLIEFQNKLALKKIDSQYIYQKI